MYIWSYKRSLASQVITLKRMFQPFCKSVEKKKKHASNIYRPNSHPAIFLIALED